MVTKLDINGTLVTFTDIATTPAAPSFGASIYLNGGVFYQKTAAGVIGTLTNSGAGTGTVTSVSVLAPIPGLSSSGSPITTNGTIIITGTLGVGAGGTGLGTTPTNGQVLIGNGSGYTLGTLTQGSNVTITNSAGGVSIAAAGSVSSVALSVPIPGLSVAGSPITSSGTFTVTGTLDPGAGGTGLGSYTAGDLLYATGAQILAKLAIGANDRVLYSNGTSPYWGTLPASGASVWSVTGTLVHLATSTNNVTVGGATDIARFAVVGDADEVQTLIRANATQSNAVLLIQDSAANTQVSVSANGDMTINEEGNDANFRVESDSDANALTVDGGNNNVGMGIAVGDASAKLDITSTTKGLLIPRMTTAQFAAIGTPATGLQAYDTDKKAITVYDGTAVRDYAGRMPQRATMWHDEATVITGNALTYQVNTLGFYGGWVQQLTAAINDEFTHSFYVTAGTYTLYALGVTFSSCGISTWYIDGGSVGTMDWYSAGVTYNVTKTVTSITIATSGYHTLNGKAASKNASSSNYELYLVKYWLKQASD